MTFSPHSLWANDRLANNSIRESAKPRAVDIQNNWARPFIEGLAARNLITSGSAFQPDRIVTRAQLAAILQLTFIYQTKYRTWQGFNDVSADHWAVAAIKQAYESGFLSGFQDGSFRPDAPVTKLQALVAIANGLELFTAPSRSSKSFLASFYQDGFDVPGYAIPQIAALTDKKIVVNYPEPRTLNLNSQITRAELAAILYQTLVYREQLPKIASQYIVDPAKPLFDVAAGQITRLEVNLTRRQVTAFQGETKIKSYAIGVGRAGWETPTGTYRVAQRIERPAWKNPFTGDVIPGGDPENPLGNYWLGFWTNGKDWSGFHGTPHRDSVGQAVSHGCIRMLGEDIKELFYKVTPETIVKVSR